VIALALPLAGVMAACSILTGLDKDYSLATSTDGATPVDGPTGTEGGADGTTGNDGTAPDTGPDAPLLPFCQRTDAGPLGFCDDFESTTINDSGFPSQWNGVRRDNADASVTIEPLTGKDDTRGLVIENVNPSAGSRQTWVFKTVLGSDPTASAGYEVEFDFKVRDFPLNYAAIGVLNFVSATPEDHGVALNETPAPHVARVNPPFPGGEVTVGTAWHHVVIRMVRNGPTGPTFTRSISVDSMSVDSPDASPSAAGSSKAEIRIGIFYTAGSSLLPARVQFDNVVVRRW